MGLRERLLRAGGSPATAITAAAALFLLLALTALDVVEDYSAGMPWTHWAPETLVLCLVAGWLADLLRRAHRAKAYREMLQRNLAVARLEGQRWRAEAHALLRGLGEAIDRQFSRWKLSTAEREVALLLLKGLTHKEIAQVRGTSERTVREQAQSVYAKAGLRNRSELSAFFLEDLLLPLRGPVGSRPGEEATIRRGTAPDAPSTDVRWELRNRAGTSGSTPRPQPGRGESSTTG